MPDTLATYGTEVETEALLRLRALLHDPAETRGAPMGLPGSTVSRRRGRGLEAIDIRTYIQGDDMRHIDRNVTARTGIPHVRTFHDERERAVMLVADFRAEMLWGTRRAYRSVAAAEALTMIGWRVVRSGGRVGLVVLGPPETIVIGPRGRETGMLAIIGALVDGHAQAKRAQTAPAPPLTDALNAASALVRSGAPILLASGFDDPGAGFQQTATALSEKSSLTALLIKDGFESAPPTGLYPYLTKAGRTAWATVSGRRGAPVDARPDMLRAVGLSVIEIDAAAPPQTNAGRIARLAGAYG